MATLSQPPAEALTLADEGGAKQLVCASVSAARPRQYNASGTENDANDDNEVEVEVIAIGFGISVPPLPLKGHLRHHAHTTTSNCRC